MYQRFMDWQIDLARKRPSAFFIFVTVFFGGVFAIPLMLADPISKWPMIALICTGIGLGAAFLSRRNLKKQGK